MMRTAAEIDEDLARLSIELVVAEDDLHEATADLIRHRMRDLRHERDDIPEQRTGD